MQAHRGERRGPLALVYPIFARAPTFRREWAYGSLDDRPAAPVWPLRGRG
jgi:hypothetical protein